MAARTAAEDAADASRRLFSVQLFVSAVDSALSDAAHREQFMFGHSFHPIDLQLDYNKLLCVSLL